MPFFERIRPIIRRHRIGLAAVLFVVLVAQYGLTMVFSDTGSAVAIQSWRAGLRALIGLPTPSVNDMEPAEQARYWLEKVENVGTENPETMCGAAWRLDQPDSGYLHRKLRRRSELAPFVLEGLVPPVEVDRDAVRRSEEEFERLCGRRVLALLSQATTAQPENHELWRARALLTFRTALFSSDWNPRTEDWPAILSEGARHDPENALYDLIAAQQLFRQSARLGISEDPVELLIHDETRFRKGIEHLQAALTRSRLQFGSRRVRWAWEFVSQVNDARTDRVMVLGAVGSNIRELRLLTEMIRWQRARAGNAAEQRDRSGAVRILGEMQRMVEQYDVRDGNSLLTSVKQSILLQIVLGVQESLSDRFPGLLSREQLDAIRAELEVKKSSEDTLSNQLSAQQPRYRLETGLLTGLGVVGWLAPTGVLPSLMLCGMLLLLRRVLFGSATPAGLPPVSWARWACCWIGGVSLSFLAAIAVVSLSTAESAPNGQRLVWEVVQQRFGRLTSAFLTWMSWPLGWICPLLAILLLALWIAMQRRLIRVVPNPSVTGRTLCRWLLRDAVLSLRAACVLLLLLHLIFLPVLIRKLDARDRNWSAWLSVVDRSEVPKQGL